MHSCHVTIDTILLFVIHRHVYVLLQPVLIQKTNPIVLRSWQCQVTPLLHALHIRATQSGFPATQTGNPMHSIQIKTMLTGYANHAAELGYQKQGPVPLSAAEMEMLLCSLRDKHHSMTGSTESLLLLRDGLLLSLLWQTCFRGFHAGSLRLDNILLL